MAGLRASSCCSLVAGSLVPSQTDCATSKTQCTRLQCSTSCFHGDLTALPTSMTPHFSGKRSREVGPTTAVWQSTCFQSNCIVAKFGNPGRRLQKQQGNENRQCWRIEAGLKETELTEQQWGPPIRLGTAQLPDDVDLSKLQNLLYQWGNSITQNANLPLPVPLKVDRVEGGVRLGYIQVLDGKVEDLVHIDVLVIPAAEGCKAMFQAIRNGKLKNSVPPGEPIIMQALLAALKKAVPLARS